MIPRVNQESYITKFCHKKTNCNQTYSSPSFWLSFIINNILSLLSLLVNYVRTLQVVVTEQFQFVESRNLCTKSDTLISI